ncbi:DsbA family protein [Henriciella litoralis]|uniref:DsbA family protein n=1 Tax=Henriciella litoralis TaxID=568102 RepID=UPI00146B7B43|nr:DsbA family protein [Henriciella litoralis]
MRVISRRTAVLAVSFLAMAACGAAGDNEKSDGSSSEAALKEMTLGADDAPVTLVEYASWTCPACLQFQNEVVGKLKSEYVETGKVKFIFREFPTAPAEISVAGFAVARCAGEDKYYDVLDELFSRQTAILSLARQGGQVKQALQQVAANHGITDPAEFDACLQNADIRRAIAASVSAGDEAGVNATPTVFMDGEKLEGYDWRQWAGMQAVLNEALGEETPAAAPVEDTDADTAPEETPADGDASEEAPGETTPE